MSLPVDKSLHPEVNYISFEGTPYIMFNEGVEARFFTAEALSEQVTAACQNAQNEFLNLPSSYRKRMSEISHGLTQNLNNRFEKEG